MLMWNPTKALYFTSHAESTNSDEGKRRKNLHIYRLLSGFVGFVFTSMRNFHKWWNCWRKTKIRMKTCQNLTLKQSLIPERYQKNYGENNEM